MRKSTFDSIQDKLRLLQDKVDNLEKEKVAYLSEAQGFREKIQDVTKELEEEKEKYKKYMKQMRKKKNEATKKWLNGYPDE